MEYLQPAMVFALECRAVGSRPFNCYPAILFVVCFLHYDVSNIKTQVIDEVSNTVVSGAQPFLGGKSDDVVLC